MKHKCLVYGNCQTTAIASLLSQHPVFSAEYEVINIPPVHLITSDQIASIESSMGSIALMVYQSVSDNYRGLPQLSTKSLLSHLNQSAKAISIPVAYFTGYQPEITYLKSAPDKVVNEPFPYHDFNLLKLYAQGKRSEDIIRIMTSEDFYDEKFVHNNFDKTLGQLTEREKGLDVQLSGFIKDNYQDQKLFHTFNHPSGAVIEFILESILSLVDILSAKRPSEFFDTDVLSRSSFPVYPSLAKALKLKFEASPVYRMEQMLYGRSEIVERFCAFYSENYSQIPSFLKNTTLRT